RERLRVRGRGRAPAAGTRGRMPPDHGREVDRGRHPMSQAFDGAGLLIGESLLVAGRASYAASEQTGSALAGAASVATCSTACSSGWMTVAATTMAPTTRTAPMRNAKWYPLVNAEAVACPPSSRCLLRVVERVARTARPSAPPTCAVVLTRPEAKPASWGVAPDIASVISAGKQAPMPKPSRIMTGRTWRT